MQRIKQKISSKLYSDNKWTGVLMSRRDKYFSCFTIDERELNNLFELDNQHWVDNLRKAQQDIQQTQRQLSQMLNSQEAELSTFLQPNAQPRDTALPPSQELSRPQSQGQYSSKQLQSAYSAVMQQRSTELGLEFVEEVSIPTRRYKLRKLPVFGLQTGQEHYDFEWPTQEDLEEVEGEVKLESIEFKSNRLHQLFSVQCSLTNGVMSTEFAAEAGLESENFGKVIFSERQNDIKKVQSNSSLDGHIYSIWFNDTGSKPVISYNTTGSGQNGKVIDIGEKEQFIGVYGMRDAKRITSLGFIVIDNHY